MRPTSSLSFCPIILFYCLNSTDLFENHLICLPLLHQNVSFTRTGHFLKSILVAVIFPVASTIPGTPPAIAFAGRRNRISLEPSRRGQQSGVSQVGRPRCARLRSLSARRGCGVGGCVPGVRGRARQ